MVAIDFPNNPFVGQTFTSGGFRWTWGGAAWNSGSGSPGGAVTSVAARTGDVVLSHTDITDWNTSAATSVAGRVGDVVLTHNDITDWSTSTQFLALTGGTLTGLLTLSGPPTAGLHAATKTYVDALVSSTASGYLPIYGGTVTGSLSVNGTVQDNAGRFISVRSGANPSFCCWDTSQSWAAGMFAGGGQNLYFGNMNGSGDYVGPWYGRFDGSGNFFAAAAVTGTYVHSTGDVRADGWVYAGSRVYTNDMMNVSGNFYVANNYAYYLQRSSSDGAWRFVDNNTTNLTIDNGGNVSARSGFYSGYIRSYGDSVADSSLRAPNLFVGGLQVVNSSGWFYVYNGVHTDSLYSRNNIEAANDVTANGVFRGSAGGPAARISTFGGDWGYVCFQNSGGYLYVSYAGNGAGGNYYAPAGSWSDARLKINIRDSEVDALAAICAIPVRAYEWNGRGRQMMPHAIDTPLGLIAQEVERAVPFVVHAPLANDPNVGDLRMIEQPRLTPYLVRAIQQLTERLEKLENDRS